MKCRIVILAVWACLLFAASAQADQAEIENTPESDQPELNLDALRDYYQKRSDSLRGGAQRRRWTAAALGALGSFLIYQGESHEPDGSPLLTRGGMVSFGAGAVSWIWGWRKDREADRFEDRRWVLDVKAGR